MSLYQQLTEEGFGGGLSSESREPIRHTYKLEPSSAGSNSPQGTQRVIPAGLITLISLEINEGHCTPR
jgi:hypothetical protein